MLTSLSLGACQFVYVSDPGFQLLDSRVGDGPAAFAGFEIRSESGFFMWGEKWSSNYRGAAFHGPALARSVMVDGRPYVDFQPMPDGVEEIAKGRVMEGQRPLRVPLVDLIAVAPQSIDGNPTYVEDLLEFVAGFHRSRSLQ